MRTTEPYPRTDIEDGPHVAAAEANLEDFGDPALAHTDVHDAPAFVDHDFGDPGRTR